MPQFILHPLKASTVKIQRELIASLGALRTMVKEVGGNYLSGLQSEIVHVQQRLRDSDPSSRKQFLQMTEMLKIFQDLHVKPQKGRRRDLKELDRTISRLSDLSDNW